MVHLQEKICLPVESSLHTLILVKMLLSNCETAINKLSVTHLSIMQVYNKA